MSGASSLATTAWCTKKILGKIALMNSRGWSDLIRTRPGIPSPQKTNKKAELKVDLPGCLNKRVDNFPSGNYGSQSKTSLWISFSGTDSSYGTKKPFNLFHFAGAHKGQV